MIILQILVSGLLLGGIYAIISIGLNLIFGVIKVVNMAHGDFLMLGMYAAFFLFNATQMSNYIAALIVFPLFLLVGYIVFRLVVKPLLGTAQTETNTILATAGLGFVLQNLALMLWSADYRAIKTAASGQGFSLGGVMMSVDRTRTFVICLVLALVMYYILMHTRLGAKVRAVSQDKNAAILMGINVDRIYAMTFCVGIAMVGVAGAIITPIFSVYPSIGVFFNTSSFVVVVLGGLGSFTGALVGGLIIGIVEIATGMLASAELAQVFSLLMFLLILFIRPQGLLGNKARV
ncbi:MAG TPA: branched-chain amino acid ABC transporter permease [Anaerovoracaceae bacterium]|nr:branched-chain amino acid ABC transporter permease [Anaerovoracaceae bacterium]